jgi:hypothetical protein
MQNLDSAVSYYQYERPAIRTKFLQSDMRKLIFRSIVAVFACLISVACYAWGLKTHLWVGQQVINDVVDDCNIKIVLISGQIRNYPVSDELCNAIRSNPEAFRAGNLGPDSFPDPIVGQTTTHPGVEGGWATDKWLSHILNSARTAEELAFAYGFVAHAAADVFAHSYVNHYAGDLFQLTDGETSVELRHFALEKYIESKTPAIVHSDSEVPLSSAGLSVPKRFLASALIYNESVVREYAKAKSGLHLASLHAARGAVQQSAKSSKTIVDGVAKVISEYYKLQAEQLVGVQQAEIGLRAAQVALDRAAFISSEEERLLREVREELKELLKKIKANEDFIFAYPGLLSNHLNAITAAAAEANRLRGAIAGFQEDINKLNTELIGIIAENACKYSKQVCAWEIKDEACLILPISCSYIWVCKFVDEVLPRCEDIRRQITYLSNRINTFRTYLEVEVLRELSEVAAKAALEARKREADALGLSLDAAKLALEPAIALREIQVAEAQKALRIAQVQLAEAQRLIREAKDAIDLTKKLIGQIEDFAKRYNLVTLFFTNWIDGLNRAGDDYIQASFNSTLGILNSSGNAFEPYQRWLQCSLMSYLGVPWQVSFAFCEVKDKFDELKAEIDKLKMSLPEPLQWAIDPLGALQDEILTKLKPEIWKAVETAADFVLKPPAGRFIRMLANPTLVTESALVDSYSNRNSAENKALLFFPNIVQMVNTDIGLSSSGQLNAETFHAMRNSVLLAKLSLLDARQLNQIFKDLAGDVATRYGAKLYEEEKAGRFTLLLDAVRSIDGNHQWQPFGLPYPRSEGAPEPKDPNLRRFGHSVHDHPHFGLRLFADPTARNEVFLRIFSGPIEGSLMLNIAQLKFPPYTHPACAQNPFPRTVDDNGAIENLDLQCASNANPVKWFDSLGKLFERFVYWLKTSGGVNPVR